MKKNKIAAAKSVDDYLVKNKANKVGNLKTQIEVLEDGVCLDKSDAFKKYLSEAEQYAILKTCMTHYDGTKVRTMNIGIDGSTGKLERMQIVVMLQDGKAASFWLTEVESVLKEDYTKELMAYYKLKYEYDVETTLIGKACDIYPDCDDQTELAISVITPKNAKSA